MAGKREQDNLLPPSGPLVDPSTETIASPFENENQQLRAVIQEQNKKITQLKASRKLCTMGLAHATGAFYLAKCANQSNGNMEFGQKLIDCNKEHFEKYGKPGEYKILDNIATGLSTLAREQLETYLGDTKVTLPDELELEVARGGQRGNISTGVTSIVSEYWML